MRYFIYKLVISAFLAICAALPTQANDISPEWKIEWPQTDFSKSNIPFSEIMSGGPAKDGIPALDNPSFLLAEEEQSLGDKEPVIVLTVKGQSKAYPLRILMWHEIVNDTIKEVPVVVTYCPLCNASIVYDRRIEGKVLDFGVSGKLRHTDMIMYDRQTESWWQQFLGIGIVGKMAEEKLTRIPSEILPFAEFKKRYPASLVLTAPNPDARPYGQNPYERYDTSKWPFLYQGEYDGPIPPLAYVISVGEEAWPLSLIRGKKRIVQSNLIIEWQSGMNSALDDKLITSSRDLGYVTVSRKGVGGKLVPVSYDMTFAFVFRVFHPLGIFHTSSLVE